MSENKEESKRINKWVLFIILLIIAFLGFYIYNNYYYLSTDDQFTEQDIIQEENGEQEASTDKNTKEDQNSNLTVQDNEEANSKVENNKGIKDNKVVESENEKVETGVGNRDQETVEQDLNKKTIDNEKTDTLTDSQDTDDENNMTSETKKIVQEDKEDIEKSGVEDNKTNDQNNVLKDRMIVRPEDLDDDNRDTEPGFGRQIYLLLIGQDQESDVNEGEKQSDSIILANLKPEIKELNLIAISSHEEYQGQKLFEYNRNQLMNLMVDFIGINPSYYFVINYEGFKKIVNLIGGIEIEIEESFEVPDLGLYLKAGSNLLSGQEALNYVRYHNPKESQFSRIKRQQQIIEGFTDKIFQRNTLLDIPKLYRTVIESIRNVETNFDYDLAVESYGFIRNSNDFDVNYKVLEISKNN